MKISRLDLDGAGSPTALVTRILQLQTDLPIPIPVEDLCKQLDITSIGDLDTEGFQAALITDDCKSHGAILVAKDQSRQRRRFSIAHELGHFLIPTHLPRPGEPSLCSAEQLAINNLKDEDRRRRMEAEANRFAALLLMPAPALRAELQRIRQPDVTDIVRLAKLFDVSKDAMARAYSDYSREAVAIILIRENRVIRTYRNPTNFPTIDISPDQAVPSQSLYCTRRWLPGEVSAVEECEPTLWVFESEARKMSSLTEQVLGQQNDFALLMLLAEMIDEDDEEEPRRPW